MNLVRIIKYFFILSILFIAACLVVLEFSIFSEDLGPGEITEDGKLKPMNVKKGDKILFGKWSGTEVKLDGDDLLIMKESDIMGIFE